MKENIYEIANLRVKLSYRYALTEQGCLEYLSRDQMGEWDLEISLTEQELKAGESDFPNLPVDYVEFICLYRALSMRLSHYSRILLHASVLEYEGEGYAFLGKSGTGKSTHSQLWLKFVPEATVRNGDKPILEFSDKIYAHGTPWQGKESLGNRGRTPLKGLCFLKQAKENAFRRLSAGEAVSLLMPQLVLPTDEVGVEKTLALADELLQNVPAYLLECDISKEAVRLSFEGMTGRKL